MEATNISSNSFSVVGDKTTEFVINRRVKLVGDTTVYGTITDVAYDSVTTVTVSLDSGSLDASHVVVYYGEEVPSSAGASAIPYHSHEDDQGSGGVPAHFTTTSGNPHSVTADEISYSDSGETVGEMLDETINKGVLHAVVISDDGGLDISWGVSEVFDHENILVINTEAGSGTCTNNVINYLKWVSGTTLTLNTTESTGNEIKVATIFCQDGDIWYIINTSILNEITTEMSRALRDMFPAVVTTGLVVSEDPDGTNALDVRLSSGVYYLSGHLSVDVTGFDTRTKNLVRWFHVAGVWDSDTNASVDPTKWDNGTNLVATTASKYYRSSFFIVGDTLHWLYPNVEYNTIADAKAGAQITKPVGLERCPRSTALVLKGDATALPGATQWFDVRPMIGNSASGAVVSDHGNLAGLSDDDHTQYLLASSAGNRTTFGTNWTDLTDSGASTLHYHTADRARANHTGTQLAATISDFQATVSGNGDVVTNTAKITNVTTNLSEGTATETTVDVNSSDGSNATLVSASTSRAGLLTKAKFDEIVANTAKVTNATHSGDVTGATELTIANGAVDIAMLSATGTPDGTTYLRGDNTWATVSGGGSGTAGELDLDVILTTNETYKGTVMTVTVDDASTVFGNALYQGTDFHFDRCDADSSGQMPCRALALEDGAGTKQVLLYGQICDTDWDWSAGTVWVSLTTGALTQTMPTSSGDQVQEIGFALSADTIMFAPVSIVAEVK